MENNKKIDLEPHYLEELKDVLNWRLKKLEEKNVKVYAFGSRTNGKTKRASDIDLAIDAGGKKLPPLFLASLKEFFSASEIPYKVDIIDLNDISESFKSCIKDDLIEIDYK
ncbi:MAG: nucleotidyltransferase domain-containing protein [Endomicrobia bacterium]|nr:nucleotidyltransferase domain-containing protein [Endomicrobiia bacterium]